MTKQFQPFYAVANNLKGFNSDSLRVKVWAAENDYRWVTTADLQDAGTNLVLDASQITAETTETVERHATGLASFV